MLCSVLCCAVRRETATAEDTVTEVLTQARSTTDASTLTSNIGITSELEYLHKYLQRHHGEETASGAAAVVVAAADVILNVCACAVATQPQATFWQEARAYIEPLLEWWKRVTDADYGGHPKPGRDLYIYMFPLQLVLLFWILFGYNSLAEPGNTSSSFSSNRLSGQMVLNFVYQVLVIIFDRLAYLIRSLVLKCIVHGAVLAYVHYKVFHAIPLATSTVLLLVLRVRVCLCAYDPHAGWRFRRRVILAQLLTASVLRVLRAVLRDWWAANLLRLRARASKGLVAAVHHPLPPAVQVRVLCV